MLSFLCCLAGFSGSWGAGSNTGFHTPLLSCTRHQLLTCATLSTVETHAGLGQGRGVRSLEGLSQAQDHEDQAPRRSQASLPLSVNPSCFSSDVTVYPITLPVPLASCSIGIAGALWLVHWGRQTPAKTHKQHVLDKYQTRRLCRGPLKHINLGWHFRSLVCPTHRVPPFHLSESHLCPKNSMSTSEPVHTAFCSAGMERRLCACHCSRQSQLLFHVWIKNGHR